MTKRAYRLYQDILPQDSQYDDDLHVLMNSIIILYSYNLFAYNVIHDSNAVQTAIAPIKPGSIIVIFIYSLCICYLTRK